MAGLPIVIDASVAVRWLLTDHLSDRCWKLFSEAADAGLQLTVPALWSCEMVSNLTKALHFDVIGSDEAREALAQIEKLNVSQVSPLGEQNRSAFEWTLRLGRVSAYDSYYLALADSLDCEFWTADKRLFHACRDLEIGWVHHIEEL